MSKEGNSQANKRSANGTPARRPGPPKGTPRPPGAGRKKGTPNRATKDVRAAAQKHTAKALRTLVKLLSDDDPKVKAIAAREILDRAHGKPMTPSEITGKDGQPFAGVPPIAGSRGEQADMAQRIAFVLTRGAKQNQEKIRNGEAGPNVHAIPAKESN